MRSLPGYFLLTYIVSWSCFAAAAALSGGTALSSPGFARFSGPLYLLGTVAPALTALALIVRAEGREGVLAVLRRTVIWRVGFRWYLFAVMLMAAIRLAAAFVYRIVTGGWPGFSHESGYIMLVAIMVSTPVQAGEEIGWRGYALPRMAARLGPARASLVLGVIWACWHLPFFLISGNDQSGQAFPVYLLWVTALSVAMAWLYWRTGGSLLLVMLMHSAVNQTIGIVPSSVRGATNPFALSTSLVAWLTVALQWMAAMYFLVRMRGPGASFPPSLAVDTNNTA